MKFYITTAIPYPNAQPHIGFGLEAVQTDVIARFHRLKGDDVFFLTGTDEHGLKVYQAAKAARVPIQQFVDQNSSEFANLKKILNLSNDDFIRTSDKKRHWPAAIKLWQKAKNKGDIYEKNYSGLYCVGCEDFKTLKDLVDGKCQEHKIKPEKVAEVNYFFRFTKYKSQVEQMITKDKLKIFPNSKVKEVLTQLKNLSDFSVSRPVKRLPWGIPVPGDGSQTIYVWFDALANYLSGIGYPGNFQKFNKFWPANLHVIGKGVLKFHALYWPAILISTDLPAPHAIFVHGYLTVKGAKISKSLGNVITAKEVVERFGTDAVRYFLLSQIPPTEDGDFTFEHFENVYNGQLANGLGNLVSRVASLCQSSGFEFALPKPETAAGQLFRKNKIGKLLEEFKFNQASDFIWGQISEADQIINREKPWEKIKAKSKEQKEKDTLQNLVERIREIASLLSPFMPETSVTIQKQFQGPKIASEKPLFPRL